MKCIVREHFVGKFGKQNLCTDKLTSLISGENELSFCEGTE